MIELLNKLVSRCTSEDSNASEVCYTTHHWVSLIHSCQRGQRSSVANEAAWPLSLLCYPPSLVCCSLTPVCCPLSPACCPLSPMRYAISPMSYPLTPVFCPLSLWAIDWANVWPTRVLRPACSHVGKGKGEVLLWPIWEVAGSRFHCTKVERHFFTMMPGVFSAF